MGSVYVHSYDPNGNRQALIYPNGVQTTYAYDTLNRLKSLVAISTATSQLVVSFAYALGPAGNRTEIVEHDGTTRTYAYDALYRLTDEHVTLAGTTRWKNGFTYDPVGNRLRQDRIETTGSQRVVTYGYDERDRLLDEASGDSTLYGWDENGNQISKSGPLGASYEWDFDNRLTKVALANGTVVEHAYDSDGTRVRTTTTPQGGSAERVDYLVDTSGLSQVIAETNAVGAVTALHVRGDDLVATLRPNAAPPGPGVEPWVARYFHAEGIGSIRALTDASGAVADRYEFESFGELLAHEGSDPNSYLFAGESLDPNVGFYHNRARWLDPNAGRFASVDPFGGSAFESITLHRYLYSGLNPISHTDPTGEDFNLVARVTVAAIIGNLATAALFSVAGGVFGALDAYFSEQDVGAGIVKGMKAGFAAGLLWRLKFLRPALTSIGLALGATSSFEAYMDGDTGLALFRGIVFVAGVTGVVTAGGRHSGGPMLIYRSVNPATGEIQYIGITRNFAARAAAHLRQKGIEIEPIGGLDDLSMSNARNVEEALIVFYGLGKNGGTLLNRIHSISPRNPAYAARLTRGIELLRSAGYPDI